MDSQPLALTPFRFRLKGVDVSRAKVHIQLPSSWNLNMRLQCLLLFALATASNAAADGAGRRRDAALVRASSTQMTSTITTYLDSPLDSFSPYSVTANGIPATVPCAGIFNVATFSATPGPITVSITHLGGVASTNMTLLRAGPSLTFIGWRGSALSLQLTMSANPRKFEIRVNAASLFTPAM